MRKIQETLRKLRVRLWPVEGPDDEDSLYREPDRLWLEMSAVKA